MGHDLAKPRNLAIQKGGKLNLDQTEQEHFGRLNEVFGKSPYEVRYLITGWSNAHDDTVILRVATRFSEEVTLKIPSPSGSR